MSLSPDTQSLVNQALIQLTQPNFSTALPLLGRVGIIQAFSQEFGEEPAPVNEVGGCCWASCLQKDLLPYFLHEGVGQHGALCFCKILSLPVPGQL